MFNFVFDRGVGWAPYPNLAPPMDNFDNGFHGMGDTYPFIVPLRILYFAKDHNYPVNISYIDQPLPSDAFYPIGLGFFNFDIDYFELMSAAVLDYCRKGQLKILFYYHEGDNPYHEKNRLDTLCAQHNLPIDCYRFVSGNTKADEIPGFIYFPDHELFYWRSAVKWNDRSMPGCSYHNRIRSHQFTVLSRVHKWWRATIMTYLQNASMLDNSRWSYNIIDMGDQPTDNPIQVDQFDGLASNIKSFVENAPYTCDELSEVEHNSHWNLVPEHFDESYWNLVLETLYDAEQSQGTFLSEKTFKPIRHAQPFVIFGTPNSLATLRSLGYRTFDHVLDNCYDVEIDNTERFKKTIELVKQLSQVDLRLLYQQCRDDLIHNQELFLASKYNRLDALHTKLLG